MRPVTFRNKRRMNCQIIYFQNRGDPEQAEERKTLPVFEEAASTAVAL
jgi:hypothetical protein